ANNGKAVELTKGSLTAQTEALTVKAKVFDPAHVEKMEVKEQPTKLIYTEGDKLELAGLVVTLTDNQGVTKDVAFADFATYAITAAPANDTALTLADNAKKVTLTKGNLRAETNALTVKEIVKTGTDPNTPVPNGYTRITFDATTDGNINGHRYKVIDVLTGTTWDNQAVKNEIPAKAEYKNTTKIFTEWDSTVPTAGPVEGQEFTATYRTPVVGPVDPTDPNGGKPA
ncbi:MAG: bacterial Ig-like domain-containing protein, partial [Peptoniphilus lacrimalis]